MRQVIRIIPALCLLSVAVLTACRSANTAGDKSAAVTGAAASGNAAEEKDAPDLRRASKGSMNDQYACCNDYHMYSESADGIVQRDFTGKKSEDFSYEKPEIERGKSDIRLMGVTNEELFYVVHVGKEYNLWCVPLDSDSHQPQMSAAEKILSVPYVAYNSAFYADDNYIVFEGCWNDGDYEVDGVIEYDRKNKRRIPLNTEKPQADYYIVESPDDYTFSGAVRSGFLSQTILVETWKEELRECTIYTHRIGSGTVTELEKYSEIAGDSNFLYNRGANWLLGYMNGYTNDKDLPDCRPEISIYNTQTGEKREILSENQWGEKKKEEGITGNRIEALITDRDRLYILASSMDEKENPVDEFIWSCPLSGGGELRKEAEMSEALKKIKRKGKIMAVNIRDNCLFVFIVSSEDYRQLEYEEADLDTLLETRGESYMYRIDTGEIVRLDNESPEVALALVR